MIRDKDIHYISLEYIPRCWKIHFTNLLRKTKLYEKKRKIERFNALYLTLDRKSRLKKKTIIFKKLFITHVHLFIYQDRVTCKNLKHDSLPPPLVHVSIARDTMSGTGVQSVRKNDVQISRLYLRNVSQFREKKKGKRCGNTLRTRLMMLDAVSLGDMCPE